MVSVTQAHGFLIAKARHFVFYNFVTVFVFGLIYYVLQYFDGKTFFTIRALVDQDAQKTKTYELLECIHFSILKQTTRV